MGGCENDIEQVRNLDRQQQIVEVGKNIEALFSQSGNMRSRLTAPLMYRYIQDTLATEFPRTLHVNFYDSLGRVESQLSAKYGKYYESYNRVHLKDSVLVFNIQGDSMRCPDMWWDQNLQKFYTDSRVWIRKSGNVINGKGFQAKQDLSDINIRQVYGDVMVPDSLH